MAGSGQGARRELRFGGVVNLSFVIRLLLPSPPAGPSQRALESSTFLASSHKKSMHAAIWMGWALKDISRRHVRFTR